MKKTQKKSLTRFLAKKVLFCRIGASTFSKDALLALFDQTCKLLEQEREDKKQLLEMIQSLQSQLDKLQRMLFGQSSEHQRSLNKKKDDKPEQNKITDTKPKSGGLNKNGRSQLPKELARKVVKHDFLEDQKNYSNCQGKLQMIGKDVNEQLELCRHSYTLLNIVNTNIVVVAAK